VDGDIVRTPRGCTTVTRTGCPAAIISLRRHAKPRTANVDALHGQRRLPRMPLTLEMVTTIP
jgi:hypothetical protein